MLDMISLPEPPTLCLSVCLSILRRSIMTTAWHGSELKIL